MVAGMFVLLLILIAFVVMLLGPRRAAVLVEPVTGCVSRVITGAFLVLVVGAVLQAGLHGLGGHGSSGQLPGTNPAAPASSGTPGSTGKPTSVPPQQPIYPTGLVASPSGLLYPVAGLQDEATYRAATICPFLAGSGLPGERMYVNDGQGRPLVHLADDLAAKEGEPVYSMGEGTVLRATMRASGFGPGWSEGGAIIVKHATSRGPLWVVYGHVKSIAVKEQHSVHAGDQLAVVGPWDGRTHLHLAVRSTPPPSKGWGTGLRSAVVRDRGIDTLGWQDPSEVLHTGR